MSKPITDLPIRVMVIITAVSTLAPFSIDAYLPVLPMMKTGLGATAASVQLTIAAFLLGLALGPMVFGPISDTVGRKRAVLAGVSGFAIASMGCALTQTVEALIVLRFMQALMSSCAVVAVMALMADVYSGDKLAARSSIVVMALTVAPMIAPLVGEFIAASFGWRGIFWVLVVASVTVLLPTLLILPETVTPQARGGMQVGSVLKVYISIFRNRAAMAYAVVAGSGAALFFTYVSATPFLYIETYGLSQRSFAWLFALAACVAILANFANIRAVNIWGYRRVMMVQVALQIAVSVLILVAVNGYTGRWMIFVGGLSLMGFLQVTGANATAGLQAQFAARRGAAAAVYMFMRFAIGMLGVASVSWLGGTDQVIYANILLGFAGVCCLAAIAALHWTKGDIT